MAANKNKNQGKNNDGGNLANDILKGINKDEIISRAQKVINSAVNVLEEEIAAGILAAKKIEKKVIDVDDIRSDPDDLMNRIRRDTHEAVDLFLDALTAITKQVNKLADSKTEEKTADKKTKNNPTLTLLETEQPLHPGETDTFRFSLLEDTEKAAKIKFQKTTLFGPNGNTINSTALKISPTSFTLKPNEEKEITVHLTLPKNAHPGVYNALITDAENSLVKVILNIEVIP